MRRRLSERWGADVWLKREDLAHTGAHKINNAIGQALLAKRLGVERVIAETGAGQHGVASAAACARVGLPCAVYMGAVDIERQAPNVDRMRRLGAEVIAVESGDKTLRAAIDEALRKWVTDPAGIYYLLGSAVGAHPYPYLVRELQSVIGRESREQMIAQAGGLPDAAFACVGGGSNAIGLFYPMLGDDIELIGVEAGGTGSGLGQNAATLATGTPGVLQGSYTMILQDADGQVQETHSISAGLDYSGVGPEHALLQATGPRHVRGGGRRRCARGARGTVRDGRHPHGARNRACVRCGARVGERESGQAPADRQFRPRRQGYADVDQVPGEDTQP